MEVLVRELGLRGILVLALMRLLLHHAAIDRVGVGIDRLEVALLATWQHKQAVIVAQAFEFLNKAGLEFFHFQLEVIRPHI